MIERLFSAHYAGYNPIYTTLSYLWQMPEPSMPDAHDREIRLQQPLTSNRISIACGAQQR